MYTLCIIAAEKFLNTGNVHVKNKFVNVCNFDDCYNPETQKN